MRRSQAGFTFLELQAVLGTIGILAAIAIPNYLGYQLRAKAEAGEILVRAIAHRVAVAAEEGRTVEGCGPTPAEITDEPVPFEPEPCWRALGFTPDLLTAHQLELQVRGDEVRVVARSDLDGDGEVRTLTLEPGALRTVRSPGGAW